MDRPKLPLRPRRTFYLIALLLYGGALTLLVGQGTGVHEHLQRANEFLQANDADSAIKEFNAVLALDPRNSEAFANLGVISFFRRDYQNASQYLSKALSIDPSLVKTEALLGICERRLGRPSAQELLEKSFPKLQDKKLAIQAGLELANIYYGQGDLDGAAAVMRSLVDLDPDNIEILYMAQRVYSELTDQTLNKLAILAPGSDRMQQTIAERLINQGDLKGATEHFRKALELNPRLPGVHYELAEAILESAPNDPQSQAGAEKELDAAMKLEGETSRTECMLARIAARRADLDGAYAHYRRAFALNPGDVEAQIGLGRRLADLGKPQEAVKYLRMAVESDPLNEEAHYRLAAVYRKLELKDEAAKELHLFQEIKETKKSVRELYRQMNKQTREQDDHIQDGEQ